MHVCYVSIFFQVDTEVCEQCFSWLSQYARITMRMKRSTFLFFYSIYVIYIMREKNRVNKK